MEKIVRSPLVLLLNFIPILLTGILFQGIFGRRRFALILNSLLYLILFIVHRTKVIYRNAPFRVSDIALSFEALKMSQNSYRPDFTSLIIFVASLIILIFLSMFFKDEKLKISDRLIAIVSIIISSTLLFNFVYSRDAIYYKLPLSGNTYNLIDHFNSKGFNYTFLFNLKKSFVRPPEGYNEKEMEKRERVDHGEDISVIKHNERPNIIWIMGEAFTDLSQDEHFSFAPGNDPNENFKKLAAMFPNAITETIDETTGEVVRAIDKDVLMQEISTKVVEGNEERYQFTWPDKKKSVLLANAPINKTLRPCREESVDFDNTENLYIEGDNLEVLKLLQETYLGKIKMIYIDPPYNTGNDFVYEDDFAQSTEEYLENSGQFDDEGNRLVKNLDSNGRFHTDWLNMIYPRLKVAKDLLSEDGAIFISIGDEELFNLQKIANEIFGASNFVANLIWQSTPGSNTGDDVKTVTENILLYCKNKSICKFSTQEITDKEKYSNQDEYYGKRGGFVLNKLDRRMTGQHYSEALNYAIEMPDGTAIYPGGAIEKQEHWNWRWSKTKVEWGIKNGFIVMKNTNNGWAVYFKQYEANSKNSFISKFYQYRWSKFRKRYKRSNGFI